MIADPFLFLLDSIAQHFARAFQRYCTQLSDPYVEPLSNVACRRTTLQPSYIPCDVHALWSWYHGLANQPSSPPPLPVEHVEDFNIARGWIREREREREWETGWANNDDCWLRFQPGIRETCRFFSPFLGIYNVYHPSATHVFPQLMAAIVERIKDTFWCIRLSGASRCRDFFNPLTYLDYPLLLEIDIDAHATKSIFPSGNGVSMQVGCNGTNWDKFQNFNNNTDY